MLHGAWHYVSQMDVWKLSRREIIGLQRAFAKGGVGRNRFNAPDALGRALSDGELHVLAEWVEGARITDRDSHRSLTWLRFSGIPGVTAI